MYIGCQENQMKFNCSVILIFLLLVLFQISVFSEVIKLEEVIKEVSVNSDDAKSMRESVFKAKQVIRENYARAFPNVSTEISVGEAYGRGYGAIKSSENSSSMPTGGTNYDPSKVLTQGDLMNFMSGFGSLMEEQFKYDYISNYGAKLNVVQPIYTFGKIGTGVKVARYYDSLTQLSNNRSIQTLQLLALDAYYRVLLADMLLTITERSVARKTELNEFLTRNFELGSGSKAQILSTKADLVSLKPEIIKARQNAQAAKMMLCVLMGRNPEDSIQLDTSSTLESLQNMVIPSKADAVQNAISDRNDLQSVDYYVKANKGGYQIYRSQYLPSIVGMFSWGIGGYEPEHLFESDRRDWTAGVALQWTLFDGFASSAKASQYLSDARKLEIGKSSLKKIIEIEIDTSIAECIAADSNVTASHFIYDAALEAYNLTDENFKQGDGQFAELQLAEERLRQGEFGIMNAKYRQVRSRAALIVAMGKTIIPVGEK
jgi:outer membrane protein TolC